MERTGMEGRGEEDRCRAARPAQDLIPAETVEFTLNAFGELFLVQGEEKTGPVAVKRAFPFSAPERYIAIRDRDGTFLGMLDDLNKLDPDSFSVVVAALERTYFLPKIVAIQKIEEKYGVMVWHVETDRGPRQFEVVRPRRDVRWLSDEQLVVEDADGNRYAIDALSRMDTRSREVLEAQI